MSTQKYAKLHRTGILFLNNMVGMASIQENIAELVRSVMNKKNLSTYDVAKNSGNRITAATVTKILNKEIRSSSLETLTSLAEGLGISADELIRIARGLPATPPEDVFEVYAERFDAKGLSKSEWQFLETFFRSQVDHYRATRKAMDAGAFTIPESEAVVRPDGASVVARIEPGRPRLVTEDELAEIKKRTTPRKKNAA